MNGVLIGAAGVPLAAFLLLGTVSWLGPPSGERTVSAVVVLSAATSAVLLGVTAWTGRAEVALGTWFAGFPVVLVADGWSLPTGILAALLGALIGAFSRRYLHRDPGYRRFHLLLALFVAGVQVVVLAGTLDLLVVGWELTGLASALLIAFFHRRRGPVAHGLRAFVTYRVCDVGLVGAAVVAHHSGPPLAIGLLLLWGSMGKAAQFPVGGWLPRAMEGPTPSSAICYGAISVSLGPYLLLRTAPTWSQAPAMPVLIAVVGGVTALHATLVGRAQTDVKAALAFASTTQVGLVLVEIGLGWHVLALVHLLGHAALRSAQILRSPSLLHDHHHLEQALGGPVPRTGALWERLVPRPVRLWLYRFALERGYLDALVVDRVVGGFARLVRRFAAADERWVRRIAEAR
ncbi:NADH:ubiquinone oxidoreductase subunit 5 (subunit L)/multisubunit Na+/H+ antiporter MnhA subunit [Saccharothrix tamanrassetensis]|uniref:NADH:ubiquinone oxidoreductase subunit 5 (Subunit L)/multisubunit Na+/H+ antiporter MnhA subunit n=1 Tax=Saccharothrix tamanrassetensis TaxID=1051531 RepID=A0A841CD34_9PSEU|nr:proton-conducting transporter membrane subunit [Saccharothrix tamanrassetensis]MBB5953666.1 NADH:ubiquinone oxidoreductase subunit 5 (subunit L)/multisubunit Na+/H+ antiporter MnhA subunit [Saccharothrix tamanrassetensis]